MAMKKTLQESACGGKKGKRVRVLLADDHPMVAKELCALLQLEFDVIATVGDGDALLAAAEALAPDVIVTDIAMPGLDGIAAASEILRRNPDLDFAVFRASLFKVSPDDVGRLFHEQKPGDDLLRFLTYSS